jgi:hypothetical protein
MKLLIVDEQVETTLERFIEANTSEGDLLISDDELAQIRRLSVGESCFLSVHFGWAEIKRIA